MSKIEVDTIAPQSGTTLTVGEAGDTVDISNATLSANLNASSLTSGTIPDARFPATLPALDGSNLTGVQVTGGYIIIDPITVTNTDTFALTSSSVAVSPASASNCIVSLNGVIQAPITSYTISGSNIIFASALTAGSDVIDFITVLGSALNVGTVSDGTISLSKLSATGTKDATTFLRGDNTFATPTDNGKVLQVISATDSTERNTTSTSFVNASNTLSVSITPSSASNKIFIIVHTGVFKATGGAGCLTIFRDSTNLGGAGGMAQYQTADYDSVSISYLDSPSSTSALTYQLYLRSTDSNPFYINSNNTGGLVCSLTAFEVAG
jgi:hypothetical protein